MSKYDHWLTSGSDTGREMLDEDLDSEIRAEHPDWDDDEVNDEIERRAQALKDEGDEMRDFYNRSYDDDF